LREFNWTDDEKQLNLTDERMLILAGILPVLRINLVDRCFSLNLPGTQLADIAKKKKKW